MKHRVVTPRTFDTICETIADAMLVSFPDNSWMVTWTDMRFRCKDEGSGPLDAICFHVRTAMTEGQQRMDGKVFGTPSTEKGEVVSSVAIERVYDPELDLDAHVCGTLIPGLMKAFADSPLNPLWPNAELP